MYKEVRVSNDKISAIICSMGAEFKSIKKDGKELMWDGNPDVWSGQAPILFPICGGLKDDKFIYDGKEYILVKHGFARVSEFEVEKEEEASVTFVLRSNQDTLKVYPFEFEFKVKFEIIDTYIKIDYSVKNIGSNTMYYSVGAHEAYACKNGVEEWSVLFEKDEELSRRVLDGNLLKYETIPVSDSKREIKLKNKYFEDDALVFTEINSRKVVLKNNNTMEEIKVEFNDFDYLLIWTKPNANYVCIEPWTGIPDFVDSDYKIENKKGITKLESGKKNTHTHTIIL